jgi:Flp pilus assembly protein TadD
VLGAALFGCFGWASPALAAPQDSAESEIRIVELQGTAELQPAKSTNWVLTQTNQILHANDRLRVGSNSRVALRWSDKSVVSFAALTEIEILPPQDSKSLSGLQIFKGILSFFHRDEPGRIRVITRGAVAGVEGTEFMLAADDSTAAGAATISVVDGIVRFSNEQGSVVVTNGQQAVVEPGTAPRLTAGFIANNLLQWCFYYPAVLDLRDLSLTAAENQSLAASLAAYRSGDLLDALAKYPAGYQPESDAGHKYYAAVLLSVGEVEETERVLNALPTGSSDTNQRLATALRQLIAAVKRQPNPATSAPQLPSELLASSYYAQSKAGGDASLTEALRLASQAANDSPEFSYAWERVAELEFSFGHTDRAIEALNKSLALAPRNAQALALRGFLLAAQMKPREAIAAFNDALEVDSGLGNAWLGRGLVRIRTGDRRGGQEDLLVAAALEPQRSLLRSYLGKVFADDGEAQAAQHELNMAKLLDPADPTAWRYSALFNEQDLHFNEGVRDLEKSQELNENRRVYRSRLLLDQDQAVRSSSLAGLYREAGMPEVSLREAARSVGYDYANYSAHQFMAESFDALRDPTRFNLRYETPWFNELLLANLLSPVGGTVLSQNVSQQEYSRLFEKDRVGLSSTTEYRSDGQVRELASQYGNVGNTAWALDLDYQHNDGVRPNNELDRIEWYTTLKQQLGPHDSAMLLLKYQDYHSGDNFQYYDPNATTTNLAPFGVPTSPVIRTNFTFDEYQKPIVVAGYHHEWSPGVHTLALGGRLENDQRFSDTQVLQFILTTNATGVTAANTVPMDVALRSQLEIYTGELNQIFQDEHQTLVIGGRFQGGTFDSTDQLTLSSIATPGLSNFFNSPPAAGNISEQFERVSAYGYYTLKVIENLLLTGGVAYDWIKSPDNFRQPPVAPGTTEKDQISPKAAIVWSPLSDVTLRGMYSRSLGGVSFDESFRLEPAQLAGFNQSYRTIIPESLVGSVAVPTFEIGGVALDIKARKGTYLGLEGDILSSDVDRDIGVFNFSGAAPPPPSVLPGVTPQRLDYKERSAAATINQLVSDEWSLGGQYRYTWSELHSVYKAIPTSVFSGADTTQHAGLHHASLYALFNHSSGFFARAEVHWYHQDNWDYSPALVSSDFWQENIFVGWRLRRQRGEISVGGMNLGDTDYRLNPLNPYTELPRKRVFVARLKFNL